MKITLAAIADYASISIEQKLHVLGIFDTIWTQAVPTVHPAMVVVIRTLVGYEDRNTTQKLRIRLEHEDGQRLFEGEAATEVGEVPPGETASGNLIINLQGIPFRQVGRYSFVITAENGEELHRIPLRLVLRS